jgi:predicted P-loop ATPase
LPVNLREYYLDHLNLSNKFDKEMALTNNLIVNLDELEAIRPSQHAALKQTLSKSKVNGRPIYGASQDDRPRYASFVATTNNPHPLSDAMGSRRYRTITARRFTWDWR